MSRMNYYRDPPRIRIRQFICRLFGHVPVPDGPYWDCARCYDVLPEGNKKRQP